VQLVAKPPPATGGRMSLKNISRGKQDRPAKLVVYGEPGVGKTSLAANARKPIFLATEDGTSQLDVARFPLVQHWDEAEQAIATLQQEEHGFETLVIDTADGLEPMNWAAVARAHGKPHLEDIGYGKGHIFAGDRWRSFLAKLDLLVRFRKMTIVIICHSSMTRVEDLNSGTYDRFGLKLHKRAVEAFTEWSDAVLFARHETVVAERKGRGRAVMSGMRILHTQLAGSHFAKNRFDLPAELPLDWQELEEAIRAHVPASAEKLKADLLELIPQLAEPEKAEKAMREWAGENPARLAQLLDKVKGKIALAEHDRSDTTPPPPAGDEEGGAP